MHTHRHVEEGDPILKASWSFLALGCLKSQQEESAQH